MSTENRAADRFSEKIRRRLRRPAPKLRKTRGQFRAFTNMNVLSHLYKYQRLTAYSLASLLNETVWLSTPTSFNDPFDCAITLPKVETEESLDFTVSEISKSLNKSIERGNFLQHPEAKKAHDDIYQCLRKSLKSLMQEIGVLCLSETPNEILMWSHYAEDHKGFCVEYAFGEETQLRKTAQPVKYSESIPSLSIANLSMYAEHTFLEACIFTKAKQWAYEKEWRVIMPKGGRLFQAPSEITAIIFGARMSSEDKAMMYQALRHKEGIAFTEAFLLEDRFAIDFRQFTPKDGPPAISYGPLPRGH